MFDFSNLGGLGSLMTLLSRSTRSGPKEGKTSAVTIRVISLSVWGKSTNPKTLTGSPFAARSATVAGGTD